MFPTNPIEQAVLSRFSCNNFTDRPIQNGIMERILKITQRTPTSLNLQNYRVIVVRDPKLIEEIRHAQQSGNSKKSKNAIPVVFCTDLKPRNNLTKYVELCKKSCLPDAFVGIVKQSTNYFIRQEWYDFVKTPISLVVRNKMLLPKPISALTSGEKTIGLVVGTFVALCTSHGIDTHIMESFADWKVQKILNIPSRFHPSVIVWCGYRAEDPKKLSLRYDSEDMIFEDSFGQPLKMPEELNGF